MERDGKGRIRLREDEWVLYLGMSGKSEKGVSLKSGRRSLTWKDPIENPNLIMVLFENLDDKELIKAYVALRTVAMEGYGVEEGSGRDAFACMIKEFHDRCVILNYNQWNIIGSLLELHCCLSAECQLEAFDQEVMLRVVKRIYVTVYGESSEELESWTDIEIA